MPHTGMRNGIVGTCVLIAMSSCIGIPVGMLCGIYLSEYARGGWFANSLRLIVDIMAGVPSIIVGVLGYEIVVARWDAMTYFNHPTLLPAFANACIFVFNHLVSVRNALLPTGYSAWAGRSLLAS